MPKAKFDDYVRAQDKVREDVIAELDAGLKKTHWMWYVFPQLRCLGVSDTSVFYGISDLETAKAYIDHPVLGIRLVEDVSRILKHRGKSISQILGHIDGMKFHSCVTLFSKVSTNPVFRDTLDCFYNGEDDELTVEALTSK